MTQIRTIEDIIEVLNANPEIRTQFFEAFGLSALPGLYGRMDAFETTQQGILETQQGILVTQQGILDTQRAFQETLQGILETQQGILETQQSILDTLKSHSEALLELREDVSTLKSDMHIVKSLIVGGQGGQCGPLATERVRIFKAGSNQPQVQLAPGAAAQ